MKTNSFHVQRESSICTSHVVTICLFKNSYQKESIMIFVLNANSGVTSFVSADDVNSLKEENKFTTSTLDVVINDVFGGTVMNATSEEEVEIKILFESMKKFVEQGFDVSVLVFEEIGILFQLSK